MTHPIPTHDSPAVPPAQNATRAPGRVRARLTRIRRAPVVRRLAAWLAVGASAVGLLRALVELVAAWRALQGTP
jgi:hypothetical protein